MVKSGLISLERLVEVMTINGRRILGLPGADGIRPGDKADLTLLDTTREWSVDPSLFRTAGRSTPYEGMTLTGKPILTISNGNVVFNQ